MTYCANISQPDMALSVPSVRPHHIDIVLPEGSPASVSQIVLDLFQAANDLLPNAGYRVSVRQLNALTMDSLRDRNRRTVIFLGGFHSRWTLAPDTRARVQQILRLSPRTVLVGSAVFLLCDAGLQDRYRAAIHPNFLAAASEEGLCEDNPGALYFDKGPVVSAISGFAALRLLLELIGSDHGTLISDAIAAYAGLLVDDSPQPSKVSLSLMHKSRGDRLIDATLQLMGRNLEEPLKINELASELGVSTRKLQRRFLDRTGVSPYSAYRALRVERAHELLTHTSLPLAEIVAASGFSTYSNFSFWLRRVYGDTPHSIRDQAFTGAA